MKMKIGRCMAAALGLITIFACTPVWYDSLPDRDRNLWQRCYEKIKQTQGCAAYSNAGNALGAAIGDGTCMQYKMNMKDWAHLPSHDARKQWLMGRGCPPYMVNSKY